MIGDIYKTKLGWAVKYPSSNTKLKGDYNIAIIEIDNSDNLTDSHIGKVVSFSIKFKKNKNMKGSNPYAEIILN